MDRAYAVPVDTICTAFIECHIVSKENGNRVFSFSKLVISHPETPFSCKPSLFREQKPASVLTETGLLLLGEQNRAYLLTERGYLYRKRRMDIFGVFSKGLSMSSTLAIWL